MMDDRRMNKGTVVRVKSRCAFVQRSNPGDQTDIQYHPIPSNPIAPESGDGVS
jgi:hypothetical protein